MLTFTARSTCALAWRFRRQRVCRQNLFHQGLGRLCLDQLARDTASCRCALIACASSVWVIVTRVSVARSSVTHVLQDLIYFPQGFCSNDQGHAVGMQDFHLWPRQEQDSFLILQKSSIDFDQKLWTMSKTGLIFKLPDITFLSLIAGLASIEKNICQIALSNISHLGWITHVDMWLSNFCTQRFPLFFSDFNSRPWCSIPLQVRAIFDAYYLLTDRPSRKSFLVTSPNIDAASYDNIKMKTSFSTMSEKCWPQSSTRQIFKTKCVNINIVA